MNLAAFSIGRVDIDIERRPWFLRLRSEIREQEQRERGSLKCERERSHLDLEGQQVLDFFKAVPVRVTVTGNSNRLPQPLPQN